MGSASALLEARSNPQSQWNRHVAAAPSASPPARLVKCMRDANRPQLLIVPERAESLGQSCADGAEDRPKTTPTCRIRFRGGVLAAKSVQVTHAMVIMSSLGWRGARPVHLAGLTAARRASRSIVQGLLAIEPDIAQEVPGRARQVRAAPFFGGSACFPACGVVRPSARRSAADGVCSSAGRACPAG